jgi:hypothetical protein
MLPNSALANPFARRRIRCTRYGPLLRILVSHLQPTDNCQAVDHLVFLDTRTLQTLGPSALIVVAASKFEEPSAIVRMHHQLLLLGRRLCLHRARVPASWLLVMMRDKYGRWISFRPSSRSVGLSRGQPDPVGPISLYLKRVIR